MHLHPSPSSGAHSAPEFLNSPMRGSGMSATTVNSGRTKTQEREEPMEAQKTEPLIPGALHPQTKEMF